MAPGGLAVVLGVLAFVSAAIALFFWQRGAVLVLPFAVVEVVALGAAFVWYARHATDGERLWFQGGSLVVESECGGRVERRELDAAWLEVQPPRTGGEAIVLRSGAHRLLVGRHAPVARRARVAREIRQTLRERRMPLKS
jgi:uncharacterized membrane protein